MRIMKRGGDRQGRRGAAAAELGVVAGPVLVFILVASTDFGRAFYAYVTIGSCARNGALYGCMNSTRASDTSGIQTAAQTDDSGLNTTDLTVPTPTTSSETVTDPGGNTNTYTVLSVTVNYKFRPIVTYLPFGYSSDGSGAYFQLTRTVKMRVAQSQPD
jgi:Flp pilus assembly protein TadG